MDGFGFLFAGGIVLLVLFGPWLLLWRANSARKRERDEDGRRWRELTSRIYTLENAKEKMQAERSAATIAGTSCSAHGRSSSPSAVSTVALVSFTFDDAPVSAATHGAAILEDLSVRLLDTQSVEELLR